MLTVSENLTKKISKVIHPETVLILDFDDGVGPFSNAATCALILKKWTIFIQSVK
ncbi:iron-sulfur cluster biosynthesis family protein [Leuconostoc pseudomesenteroides]|uniref:iron-sulfur cluster biosynthesis family protein n=1 Tax=Leuconostoc pseudomesenteroides TaxID=33968 RepID=UPI0022866926|nr:iron-sulfur cluster biosynthesis family protein [Leuconostoc pseudomesenteroides]WAM37754.1 hypothetical protein OYT93_05980 [Leuconostoc pseudomesenteroides]